MKQMKATWITTALIGFSLSACSASADHDHDHGVDGHIDSHAKGETVDHSKFGHLSAIYLCADQELQTKHTDKETTLSYLGTTVDASRKVSIIDNAFAGETFKGTFKGQSFIFKGIGYDASMTLGSEVISCEKITCIPLGGPH